MRLGRRWGARGAREIALTDGPRGYVNVSGGAMANDAVSCEPLVGQLHRHGDELIHSHPHDGHTRTSAPMPSARTTATTRTG
jgi:hypothetical protein